VISGSVDIARLDEDEVTVKMLFGTDNPLIDTIRGLYKEVSSYYMVL
jgi:hypothetical protein